MKLSISMEEIKGESVPAKEMEQLKDSVKKKLSSFVKDNYDKIFIVVLIVAFILRMLVFAKTMNQPLWWDEADYLSASKKWAFGLNISDIWYYRRGFLWAGIGAVFFKLGLGEVGMRFLVALMSTGIVAISYALISKMFDKKIALLTSIGLTFSWVVLFFTGRVLTDIPATFFVLLALLFFWKGYVLKEGNKFLYLFGIFFSLSLLVRFQFAIFALPFFIFILLKEKSKFIKNKHLWITLGLAFAVLLPFFILYWTHYGNIFTDILSHYFGVTGVSSTEPIQKSASALLNYFKDMPYILTKSIFVLFIIGIFIFFQDLFLGIDKIFKNEEIQKKFFIFLWISATFLILGYITLMIEERYVISTLPFLFAIAFCPLIKLGSLLHKHYPKISLKIGYALSIIFLLFLLTISLGSNMPSNYSWSKTLTDSKITSYEPIRQAGMWIKANSNPTDLVLTPSRPQIVYYSERSVQAVDLDVFVNESYFLQVVQELKPRYMVLSVFEQSPEWIYSYPQNHTELLTPVQAYSQDEQTVAIVYEFNYS